MAIVHKLRYDSTDLDLNDTSTGIGVEPGWIPAEAMPTGDGTIPPYVQERIPVLIDASSGDNLASQRQTLAYYQKLAAEYWVDPTQDTPVWYHIKLDDETGERRALVKSIEFQPAQSYIDIGMGSPAHVKGTLIIERHPYWERTAAVNMNAATPSAAASVVYDYTNVADIVGDVGARIERLRMRTTLALDRFWIGIRSVNKHGTVTDFENIWECEDGTNNASESGITDDTTSDVNGASPGGGSGAYVEVVETDLEWDDTWNQVLIIALTNVTSGSYYEEQFGNFLWLLRAKVTSGTWEIETRFGYTTSTAVVGERIEITNTDWDFYEAGIYPIPIRNLHTHQTDILGETHEGIYRVHIWARRTSGSGDLHLDCLCPVPLDEGFAYVGVTDFEADVLGSRLEIMTAPEDDVGAIPINSSGYFIQSPEHSASRFYLPPGDGRMIIVYARASSSVLTDTVSVNYQNLGRFYPRWFSLRGAE